MKCRHCGNDSFIPFADLQNCPPSNSMLTPAMLHEPEVYYPLVVEVCDRCFLAQVDEHKKAEDIFSAEYTYFSSYSSSWLAHCRRFAEAAVERFGLGPRSQVIEIASNDGYLLQYFKQAGVPVLGVEPTANTAAVAMDKGIDTIVDFFGERLAREELAGKGRLGDLICGNNVYAHVPDINDFTAGLKAALAPGGVISLEFPHLLKLIEEAQFDTIYHEHFSYLSLTATQAIFAAQGLKIFDVERLTTHGGSLRVFGTHEDDARPVSDAVRSLLEEERAAGLTGREVYESFQRRIETIRADFLAFLLEQRKAGKTVVGYGAAAKGNTLLNYSGVKGNELVRFVADLSPHKQGKYLPGSHIPVLAPEAIDETRPDFIVIFPWNIRDEVVEQLGHAREWGAKFVVAVPELAVI
ncbi:MAG: methyltransferase domain-containing protein [Allosphingosinicella sp.]|uniref:methyltransferase domain-containing protein n=1 Tax=Allosphingosinicella sp. TaxID=2823234 RepID=UPI00395C7A57